jgi:DNA-binding response OmpR family regulator
MPQGLPLVLVVEVHVILALDMQTVLRGAGMRAAIAASPEEARACIARQMPAVAVVNLSLRGDLDGLDLASELTARGVTVVLASAYAREELPQPLPEVAAYLRKPVAPDHLVAAVRAALANTAP